MIVIDSQLLEGSLFMLGYYKFSISHTTLFKRIIIT